MASFSDDIQDTVLNYSNEWFGVMHIIESVLGDFPNDVSESIIESVYKIQEEMDNLVILLDKN